MPPLDWDAQNQAQLEGYLARMKGLEAAENPYLDAPNGRGIGYHWRAGWNAAEKDCDPDFDEVE